MDRYQNDRPDAYLEKHATTPGVSEEYLIHPDITPLDRDSDSDSVPRPSALRLVVITASMCSITFAGGLSTGFLTIQLPRIANEIHLQESLLFWPSTVYNLCVGCLLLLAGTLADLVGCRVINVIGCLVMGIFIILCGVSRSGIEMIVFRGCQGVAAAFCLPTSFSLISNTIAFGRPRNIAIACLGIGQPIGWGAGLFLGGILEVSAVGWRFGFYIAGGFAVALAGLNGWLLPPDQPRSPISWYVLRTRIDWVGAVLASGCLGILTYVLANLTVAASNIRLPSNIELLVVAVLLMPAFVFWMYFQQSHGRPALIPNSLWKNGAFSCICVVVLLSWAAVQNLEWFFSLFFQEVQLLSPVQTSLRILPEIVVGVILDVMTGVIVQHVHAGYLLLFASLLSSVSPLLMAVIHISWPYWWCGFWAVSLSAFVVDVNFTVANLLISDVFGKDTQALASGVYNVFAQFGGSLGLALMAVLSSNVTERSAYSDKSSPRALMVGYRAVFWACLAMLLLACAVIFIGMRGVGRIGGKARGAD